MLRRKRFYVIYPEYFDKDLPRNRGRKIPRAMASEKPTLNKLIYACKKLEIDYEAQEEKAHPVQWWKQNGRLLLPINRNEKRPKSEIITEIAAVVKRLVPKKTKKKISKSKGSSRTPPVR